MPNIKTYDNQVAAPKPDDIAAASWAQAGRRVGIGITEAGANIGQAITNHEQTLDNNDLSNGFSQLDQSATLAYQDYRKTANPADENYAQDFITQHIQPQLDKMAEGIRTKEGQAKFDSASKQYTLDFFHKAVSDSATTVGDQTAAAWSDTVNTGANGAAIDPSSFKQRMGMLDTLAPDNLPPEHRATLLANGKESIATASAEGLVSQAELKQATPDQIDGVKQALQDPDYVSHVNPGKYQSLMNRLDNVKTTSRNVQSVVDAQALPDVYTQMKSNGGIDVNGQGQARINAYQGATPEATTIWKAEQQRKYDEAMAGGKANQQIFSMSQPDAEAAVTNRTFALNGAPADQIGPLKAQRDALYDAVNTRAKLFAADPAGYVVKNSPNVQAAYGQFQQNPTPQSFQKYAITSTAEQTRIYPDKVPTLVTPDISAQAANVVRSITQGPEGAAGAAQGLATMSQTYGKYWPQMAQDLMHNKTLNGSQYVAATLYSKPESRGLSEQILYASSLSPGDRFNVHGVPDAPARNAAISALAPLANSLGNANNGHELISSYVNALAGVIQTTSTDKESLADAGALAKKMVLDEFQFVGPGKALRVPSNLDPAPIETGLAQVNYGLDQRDLVAPPSYSGALGPTNQHINWVRQLRSTGKWFANEDNSGAILYDSDGHSVLERKGGKVQEVEMSWADLKKLGTAPPMTRATGLY